MSGDKNTGLKDLRSPRSGLPLKMVLIVLVTLLICGGLLYLLRSQMSPIILGLGGFLSFAGLYALIGSAVGLVRHEGFGEKQQFYDQLNDASGRAIVVTDAQGRAVYANAPYLALAQRAGANRLVGFDVLYTGYADFAEPVYQLAQAAREQRALQRDVRIAAGSAAPGGDATQAKWLRLRVSPLALQGPQGHMMWSLEDISEDRAHQEQAFSRLQFIITYLDHAPAGFFSTLPNGKVDYVNATLASWLGLDVTEIQNGKLMLSELVGADVAKALSSVHAVGKPSRTDRFTFTVQNKRGEPLTLDFVNRLDFDRDGQPLPARSMVMRRDGEEGAEAVSRVADTMFMQSAPIGVAEIDAKGILVEANPAFLELSSKFKLGAEIFAPVRATDVDVFKRTIAAAAATFGTPQRCDVAFDGDPQTAAQFDVVKLNADAKRLTVFAADKTESKSLEVQLAQSQKMQAVGQLASGIAHDFNNVLTPIIGFADLLLGRMRPTDPAFADVNAIKQNANRAANLVRQLLAFSRKQTMQPKVHSLTEAMSELDNLLSRVLGNKTEFKIVHARDLGLVMVDVHQFEQVIINLAVNARDAMPGGGALFVRTRNISKDESQSQGHPLPSGEYVLCEVEDTGTGIPKEILDKIWEPFFSTKEVGKGTGLGLSMVYGIVKQTGGFIYCDSVMGKGTTFKIYLPRHYPVAVDPALVAAKPVMEEVRQDFTGKGRILVVEDEDSVRAFAVRALTSRGFTVMEANSGEVGLEVIEDDTQGFELILSDVVMPEMDGPTFLSELRKRGNKTRFMFMSGYAEDAFERNLENPDDFGFIQKPFSLKQLVEKVKEMMA